MLYVVLFIVIFLGFHLMTLKSVLHPNPWNWDEVARIDIKTQCKRFKLK